jgi:hypothetical protein
VAVTANQYPWSPTDRSIVSRASDADFAWAAGLFEGEGCICCGPSGRPVVFSLTLTDRDVLYHFLEVVGVGAINTRKYRMSWKPHYKPAWVWGDFEGVVFATSEEGFAHFWRHHEPSAWDYHDI